MIGRRVLVFILALAAAGPLWSGQVQAPARSLTAPIYAPAAQAWLKPAGKIQDRAAAPHQVRLLIRYLRLPGRPEALQRQLLAPIAHHLQTSEMRLAPAALETMSDEDRQAAFELAAELAVESLQAKGYELEGRARKVVWAKSLDPDARKSLFELVSELKEVQEHYRAYLSRDQRRQLQRTYALAAARAYEVRASLMGDVLGQAGVKAASGQAPAPSARGPPAAPFKPPAKAGKLLAEMKNNNRGWGEKEIGALLTGYGFVRSDSKHIKYTHSRFRQLSLALPRQRDLSFVYADQAVELAETVELLHEGPAGPAEATRSPGDGHPAVDLEELAILVSPPAEAAPAGEEKGAAERERPPPRASAKAEPRAAADRERVAPAALQPADKDRKPQAKAQTPAPERTAEEPKSQSLLEWFLARIGL